MPCYPFPDRSGNRFLLFHLEGHVHFRLESLNNLHGLQAESCLTAHCLTPMAAEP